MNTGAGSQSRVAMGSSRDPERALRQISTGVDLLERRLAQPLSEPRAGDDDLLLVSLALSLERLAGATDSSTVSAEQRARLVDAAGRIRTVISELAGRERRRMATVTGEERVVLSGPPVAQAAAAAPRTWSPARIRTAVGGVLLALGLCLGLFLAFEYGVTGTIEARSQRTLLGEFRQRLAIGPFDSPSSRIASGPAAVLAIPAIGLDQVVVEGTTTQDLKQGPGHVANTPLPGEYGNAVVIAHRQIYGGPFASLDRLHPGDPITVTTGQGLYTYHVSKVVRVRPGQRDVIGPATDSRLTLVTSVSPFSDDRLAVIAKLQGPPVGVPRRAPINVGQDQLGLAGDSAGAFIAVLAAQALIVALLVAVRLYRRWPPAAAYLVTTPIVLAILWFLFENLDRFLPGTL
jgi:sortase A